MSTIDTMAAARKRARLLIRSIGTVDAGYELRFQLRRLEDPSTEARHAAQARLLAPALIEALREEGANVEPEVARLRLVCASGAPEVRS